MFDYLVAPEAPLPSRSLGSRRGSPPGRGNYPQGGISTHDARSDSVQRLLFSLALAGLLVLRFNSANDLYLTGTCVLTCICIWLVRNRLADFNMSGYAVILLALAPWLAMAGVILSGLPRESWRPPALQATAQGLLLAALFFSGWRPARPTPRSVKWAIIGILVEIACGIFSGLAIRFFGPTKVGPQSPIASLRYLQRDVPVQLAFAASAEEPLFRGLLWGYLRDRDWPEKRVFATVAALFWIAHFYYITAAPISFWLVVPLCSTVFTYLAWRSRSIGTTMITHALSNAIW